MSPVTLQHNQLFIYLAEEFLAASWRFRPDLSSSIPQHIRSIPPQSQVLISFILQTIWCSDRAGREWTVSRMEIMNMTCYMNSQ